MPLTQLVIFVLAVGSAIQVAGAGSEDFTPRCRAGICDDRPECPRTTCTCIYASKVDCAVYYQCVRGKPHQYRCSPGLLLNPVTLTCDYDFNVKCNTTGESTTEIVKTTTTTTVPTAFSETTTDVTSTTTEKPTGAPDTTLETTRTSYVSTTTPEPIKTTEILDTTQKPTTTEAVPTTTEKPTTTEAVPTTTEKPTWTTENIDTTIREVTTTSPVSTSTQQSTTSVHEVTTTAPVSSTIQEDTTSTQVPTSSQEPTTSEEITDTTQDLKTTTKVPTTIQSTTTKETTEASSIAYSPSTEQEDTTVTIVSTIFPETTSKTETTVTDINATTLQPTEEFICPAYYGLFPDPKNCRKFYQCSHMISYHITCPSDEHFNPVLLVCDWPYRAGCNNTETPTTEIADTTTIPNTTNERTTTFVSTTTTTEPTVTTENLSTTSQEATTTTRVPVTTEQSTTTVRDITTDTPESTTMQESTMTSESSTTTQKPTQTTQAQTTTPKETTQAQTTTPEVTTQAQTTTTEETTQAQTTTPEVTTQAQTTTTEETTQAQTTTPEVTTQVQTTTTEVTTQAQTTTLEVTTQVQTDTVTTRVPTTSQKPTEATEIPNSTRELKTTTGVQTTVHGPDTIITETTDATKTDFPTTKDEHTTVTIFTTILPRTTNGVKTTWIENNSTTSQPPGEFICPAYYGLFPDPKNCKKFYHCSHRIPYHKRCPSDLHFNPTLLVCDWPYRAGCGTTPESRTTLKENNATTPQPSEDFICPAYYGLFPDPRNCRKFYHCSHRIPYHKKCPSDLHFNPNLLVCDWPYRAGCKHPDSTPSPATTLSTESTTDVDNVPQCDCDYCFLPVPGDCDRYLLCEDGVASELSCGSDLDFNPMTGTCDLAENMKCVPEPLCPSPYGRFPYPDSCAYFLECRAGVRHVRKCPEGLNYDVVSETCAWTGSCGEAPHTPPPTSSPVDARNCTCDYCFLADDDDCSKFVKCSGGKAWDGECEDGLFFNRNTQLCDYDDNVQCIGPTAPPNCPADFGFFPYPDRCNLYIQCVEGNPIVKKCTGILHFDAKRNHCDWPWSAGCDEQPDSYSTPEENPDTVFCTCECCIEPVKGDCAAFTVCISNVGVQRTCSFGLLFNPTTENCDFEESVHCSEVTPAASQCPEPEGLFPIPDDCQRFVHCIDGVSTIKECPSNLHFNPTLRVCDDTNRAGCQNLPSTEPPTEIPDQPCDLCHDCFIPNEYDCAAYTFCDEGTAVEKICSDKLLFNPVTNQCDSAENVNCNASAKCPKSNGLFPTEDCTKFIYCSDGIPRVKECPSGLQFNPTTLVCDWPEQSNCGEIPFQPTVPPQGPECPCDCCMTPDEWDCTKYYLCLDGVRREGQCSQGLFFNSILQNCDFAQNVDCDQRLPVCLTPEGLFSNPDDCNTYYQCVNGAPNLRNCPSGLHFKATSHQCELPCSAQCDLKIDCTSTSSTTTTSTTPSPISPHCPELNGLIPNAEDCTSFYQCSNGRAYTINCPPGLHFSAEYEVCEFPCDARCNMSIDCTVTTVSSTSTPFPISPLCKSENGLNPNPADCASFYKCSDGHPYLVTCPRGQHYSVKHEVCEQPCQAKCDPGIDCTSTVSSISTTATPSPISPLCPESNGLFPNREDCTSFYQCSNGNAYTINCPPGLHFSVKYEVCEFPCDARCNMSIDCSSPTTTNTPALPTEPVSPICRTPNGMYANPDDCGSYYDCSNGHPQLIQCPSQLHFSVDDKTCEQPCVAGCDLSIVCPTEHPVQGNCSCEDCYLPDPTDCSAYYFCHDDQLTRGYCPHGMLFNRATKGCDREEHVECEPTGDPAMCSSPDGTFPYPGECSKFVYCEDHVAYIVKCASNQEFHPDEGVCGEPVDGCGTPSVNPNCKSPTGLFAYPNNCSLFYQCDHGTAYVKECPESLLFNSDLEVCDWPEHVHCGKEKTTEPEVYSTVRPNDTASTAEYTPSSVITVGTTPHTETSTEPPCHLVPGVICPCACRVPTYDDCSTFYQCRDDGTACKKSCPQGLYFNKKEMVCDLPQHVKCRDFFFSMQRRQNAIQRLHSS